MVCCVRDGGKKPIPVDEGREGRQKREMRRARCVRERICVE